MPHRIDRDKFFSKLILKPDTNCMEWPGYTRQGYGSINAAGGVFSTHRLAAYFAGMIPHPRGETLGTYVLHKCDNRRCCNPDHLFIGNHKDNMLDMIAKGRGVLPPAPKQVRQPPNKKFVTPKDQLNFGDRHKSAKLTNEQVETIRLWWAAGMYSQGEMARMFGVAQPNISLIVRNKSRTVCG